MSEFSVTLVRWEEAAAALSAIREEVFIIEQHVPRELEIDPLDPLLTHALAIDSHAQPIGTGRLMDDGKIGRMAVRNAWRGKGVGRALLSLLTETAHQRGLTAVWLESQQHARIFYEQQGFTASGEIFMDAGIPHIRMTKKL